MKTNKFIEEVKKLGLIAKDSYFSFGLLKIMYGEEIILEVHTDELFSVNSLNIDDYGYPCTSILMDLVWEYISTPIEEREETKKYYLRLPNPWFKDLAYLNLCRQSGKYIIDSDNNDGKWQTQFTQEEIDNLPEQSFIKTLIKEEVDED